MTARHRWAWAAAIGLPLVAITAYLLWIWPRPRGNSVMADTAPYIASLLTGAPFAWSLARRSGGWLALLAYLVGGFTVLYFYAMAVLCGVRGVCL